MSEQIARSRVKKKRQRRPTQQFPATTKCEAVLSVWSERRRPAEVCRQLGISWTLLSQWQNKALEGMIEALEPKKDPREATSALSPKLEQRLQKRIARREDDPSRLERRLTDILESRETKKEEPGR